MIIEKRMVISSAHKLNLPYESKCNFLHGHNWVINVTLGSDLLENSMVIDFTEVKKEVMKLDHVYLNDIIENPTAENIILYLIRKFVDMKAFNYIKIRVEESENNFAEDEWRTN